MNISELASNLKFKDGIYTVEDKSLVSFPDEGNSVCFQLEDNSFWFNHRNKCLLSVIKRFYLEGAFLDIGGGNGFVAKMLQDNGYETILVEPGLSGCINAKGRGLKNIINAALEDISFSPSVKPGAMGAFDVVEHIEDDSAFLRKCHQVLGDKGKLFITVPAFQTLWSEDDVFAGHFRRYTIESLGKIVKEAGFKINFASYFFQPLVLPIWLFRTIPSIFKSKKISADNSKKEHGTDGGIMINLINYLLKQEAERIDSRKQIRFGSSILMVAEK